MTEQEKLQLLRENPFTQLLSIVFDKPVDEIIKNMDIQTVSKQTPLSEDKTKYEKPISKMLPFSPDSFVKYMTIMASELSILDDNGIIIEKLNSGSFYKVIYDLICWLLTIILKDKEKANNLLELNYYNDPDVIKKQVCKILTDE